VWFKKGGAVVWDVATKKQLHTLSGHESHVYSLAYSPDGKTLATGGCVDGQVKLWDPATGEELATLQQRLRVLSVAFSPDGKTLAAGLASDGKSEVALHDAKTHKLRVSVPIVGAYEHVAVWTVAFSTDSQSVAVMSRDGKVRRWPLSSLGRSGKVSAGPDRILRNGPNQVLIRALEAPTAQSVMALRRSRDWSSPRLFLLDPMSGKEKAAWDLPPVGTFWHLATSSDASAVALQRPGGGVDLWHPSSGQARTLFTERNEWGYGVEFSPDSKTVATCRATNTAAAMSTGDDQIKLWEVRTGRQIGSLKGHTKFVHAVAFSPDGKLVATGSSDRTVRLWEAATGRQLFSFVGHTDQVRAVTFDADGKRLASGDDAGWIKLWDVKGRVEKGQMRMRTAVHPPMRFTRGGRTLAVRVMDHESAARVHFWDTETRVEMGSLRLRPVSLFEPDDQTLMGRGPEGIEIYRADPPSPEGK
jgi:WD40 repeat protein